MILPIYLLGNPVLREITEDVPEDSEVIQSLIDDMLETMHHAKGIGLAAPQIGRSERIFVVDVSSLESDLEEAGLFMPDQPMVFINPKIVSASESESDYEEGCLSIPDIHEDVMRPEVIQLKYLDRDFSERQGSFSGMLGRVLQHEYDHLEGILFIDHISSLRRRLLKRRLKEITAGETDAEYPVYFLGKEALV
jgi:peptide deformylase